MKNSECVYNLILDIDSNVEPSVLTFGSLLFDFVNTKTWKFNFDAFRLKAKTYLMYSEKNICKTFEWLENNKFIYYSIKDNTYYVTDLIKDVVRNCKQIIPDI